MKGAASIADDAIWHVPGAHRFAGTFEGKPAIMGRFPKQAEAGVRLAFDEIHDIVGGEDHVVALLRTTMHAPGATASGNSVFVLHVGDGKLRELFATNEHQADIDRLIGS